MQVDGCIWMPFERGLGNGYSDFCLAGSACGDFPGLLLNSLAARSQSSACDVCHSIQRRFSGLGKRGSGARTMPDLAFIGLTLFIFLVMIGYVRFCTRMKSGTE